ncbi:DNA gyrase subunit B [Streptomyces sp. PLK6-54]|uniref:DNA topoisomerase (ATP-hydrolyzing) n=2 Tax=Actinacidiphila acidipaludis TaxID=2873382 RepID=A0ABS7QFK4_9ACTN|nr:DNA gyrase subunit B [Streptomyces acidipaludis]
MYVGTTTQRGLHTMVFQVIGRSVDEVLDGRASRVTVTLRADGGVCVADDGGGVPMAGSGSGDGIALEDLLTCDYVWSRADGRRRVLVSSIGLGPFVANALSTRMTAEVESGGAREVREYARGVATEPAVAGGPATGDGTTITFWPDPEIFPDPHCAFDELADRLREVALLNRRLDLTLTDERPADGPLSLRLHFPGGAREFVAFLDAGAGGPAQPEIFGFEVEDERSAGTVEVALRWRDDPEERIHGFANSRATKAGTHLLGLRDGLAAALTAYARQQGLLPETAPDLSPEAIGVGLTAVVSVKLDTPEFEGATRGVLGGTQVRSAVAGAVRDHLGAWLRADPARAAAVVRRVLRGGEGR